MIVGMGAAAFVVESAEAARERGLQPICEVLGDGHRQQRLPRHPARRRPHRAGDGGRRPPGRGARRRPARRSPRRRSSSRTRPTPRPAAAAPPPRSTRCGRPSAPTPTPSSSPTPRASPGTRWAPASRTSSRSRRWRPGSCRRCRTSRSPTPTWASSTCRPAAPTRCGYALRLAAGFGSQIAMSLLRWTPMPDGRHRAPNELGYAYRIVDPAAWQRWLDRISGMPGARLEVSTGGCASSTTAPLPAGQQGRGIMELRRRTAAPARTAPAPTAPTTAAAVPAAPSRPRRSRLDAAAAPAPAGRPAGSGIDRTGCRADGAAPPATRSPTRSSGSSPS